MDFKKVVFLINSELWTEANWHAWRSKLRPISTRVFYSKDAILKREKNIALGQRIVKIKKNSSLTITKATHPLIKHQTNLVTLSQCARTRRERTSF